MEKLYDLITWHNNTTPAINEDNLNAMSDALDGVDTRVVQLANTVLDVIPQAELLVEQAVAAAEEAIGDELDAEAWAKGTRDGVPVESTDPAYHNNSKYYSELADPTALRNMSDVDISSPSNSDVLRYNSSTSKWENSPEGGSSASGVSYDNTDSGLTATNVQDAIDEVVDDHSKEHTVTRYLVTSTTGSSPDEGWTYTWLSYRYLYKRQVAVNHIYAVPSIYSDQENDDGYNLINYVTYDDTVPCLYLYAENLPSAQFYINVEGVD